MVAIETVHIYASTAKYFTAPAYVSVPPDALPYPPNAIPLFLPTAILRRSDAKALGSGRGLRMI